ncbi:MAG: CRTAC1 family protein [Planctomycetota bacterium]
MRKPRQFRPLHSCLFVGLVAAAIGLVWSLGGCGSGESDGSPGQTPPVSAKGGLGFAYVDVAKEMGFLSRNRSGRDKSKEFILEAMPPGIAVADFDGNGWMDLYVPNGNTVVSYQRSGKTFRLLAEGDAPRNQLFLNREGKRFEEVAAQAGVADTSWSFGSCAGDIDNDGDPDILLCNWGRNRLFLNDGKANFTEAKCATIGGDPRHWSCGACLVDYDGDGDLDVYIAQYLDLIDLVESDTAQVGPDGKVFARSCEWRNIPVYCGPLGLLPINDRLLKNELSETGKLTFTDVTKEAGMWLQMSPQARNESSRGPFFGFQPVAWDINGDGHQDIFVANDSVANLAWINKGDGTFEDQAHALTLAISQRDFSAQASMGVAVGDINRDGLLDVTVTEFSHDHFNLMICKTISDTEVVFNERAVRSGLREMTFAKLGWGALLFDPDLDGDDDIFFACGHVYPEVDQAKNEESTYRQTNLLILNVKPERLKFRDVSNLAGPGLALQRPSRAAVRIDFDNDGDPDIAIIELNEQATLLRCDLAPAAQKRHWLEIRLRGNPKAGVPMDPAGALVRVKTGKITQTRVRLIGSSFLCSEDPRLHFGLGDYESADVEVTWPNGTKTLLTNVPGDQRIEIACPDRH